MKRLEFEKIIISSILLIGCLVVLLVSVEVLPIWLTDPYTYSAYKTAKQVALDLNKTLTIHSKMYGMTNNFSDFTSIYSSEKNLSSDIYSFEPLLKKGIKVGTIENDTLKFNNRDLDGAVIEVRWLYQKINATYKLQDDTVVAYITAIFNMGEIIEEEINSDPGLLESLSK